MSWKRTVLIAFGGLLLLSIVVSFFRGGDNGSRSMDLSDLISAAREGRIERLNIRASTVSLHLRDDAETYPTRVGTYTDLVKILQDSGVTIGGNSPSAVRISYDRPTSLGNWIGLLISIVPALGVVLVFYYAVRNAVREGVRRGNAASVTAPRDSGST